MSARDAWQVLGIPAGSTPEVIKAAYYERAKTVHPDVPGGSRDAWDELESAYTLLVAAGMTDVDQWMPEDRPAEKAVKRWRTVKRPWRVVVALGLGLAVVVPSAWGLYAATRTYAVPSQMILWPGVYVFGWFVWWALLEFRRPTLRPRRYYATFLTPPSGQQERAEFDKAMQEWDEREQRARQEQQRQHGG